MGGSTRHAEKEVTETVGDLIARYLADIGVTCVFGVISIHNMPILDAIARQGRIRFVSARGEAGAMSMADAYARVSRALGVVITSTGTAAGNAAGAQVEALTAGSPVLHITSQIDRAYIDQDRAAIHDVPHQPELLRSVSKRYVRMWQAGSAVGALQGAVCAALAAPQGPVSLEIPIDVQREAGTFPRHFALPPQSVRQPDPHAIAQAAAMIAKARRPMLWLGGGARDAGGAVADLVRRGFCAVSSTHGRAILAETDPRNLGAYNMTAEAQAIYGRSDLMVVVGSRLRGNETRNYTLKLPSPLIQIDIEDTQAGRNFPVDLFIGADASTALTALCDTLPSRLDVDAGFAGEVSAARAASADALAATLGPYRQLADVLNARLLNAGHPWVRDVTISNSTFGNRYVGFAAPHLGVHALGGGIGMGIAMGVGAALAEASAKTVALLGDGGAMLGISELMTAVETEAPVVYVLMNDQAYGVIRNIQDAQYGGRHHYCAPKTPDFAVLAQSMGLAHMRVESIESFSAALDRALERAGPVLVEVDMLTIGPFAHAFGGPPAGAAGGQR